MWDGEKEKGICVFRSFSDRFYAADVGNCVLDHFLFHLLVTGLCIPFSPPCPQIMTLIAEDLIEFNAIANAVGLIILWVIVFWNKNLLVQLNLCSIRIVSSFGARRKIRFNSNVLLPTLLHHSHTFGVSFLFIQAGYMEHVCPKVTYAVIINQLPLCMIWAGSWRFPWRHRVSHKISYLFQSLSLQKASTSFWSRWRRNQI